MKHLFPIVLAFSLLLSPVSTADVHAATPVRVLIDGNQPGYDQPPVNVFGTTMLPFRPILETLGAEVTWDGTTQRVTAKKRNRTIVLQIGSDRAYQNGLPAQLPQVVQLVNGQTMVPLRFVSEAFGAEVSWDGATQTVKIISAEKRLLAAAAAGDLQKVKGLLAAGVDLNAQDKLGWSALHLALRYHDVQMVQILLDAGANPELRTITGDAPLGLAIVYNRDPKVLQMLTAAGVDVTDTAKHGTSLLNTAIAYNNTPMLKALLAAGVDPNRYPNQPPLVQAAFKGDVEGVKALLAAKADPFAKTADGYTAMMYALAANRQEVVALLRQAGDTTTTLPAGLAPFDEKAEIKRLQGILQEKVVDGMNADGYDYGLNPTEAIMFLEIPYEDDREAFFNLSERAQKELIFGYFQDHYGDVLGVLHCYTYITWDGNVMAGADLNHDMEAEAVDLVIGPRVPMK